MYTLKRKAQIKLKSMVTIADAGWYNEMMLLGEVNMIHSVVLEQYKIFKHLTHIVLRWCKFLKYIRQGVV